MSKICYNCFNEYEGMAPCPNCGFDPAVENRQPLALRGGTILSGRYIVGRVLGQGGFGITYAAQDYDSKAMVAIKEHFPTAIVTRMGNSQVSIIDSKMSESFYEGKEKFLAEAKTISQFNGLENICDIYSYFEENGTAYFAMEYVRGIPLDEYMKGLGRLLSFEEAVRLLLPAMEALSHVHEKGIIHRDIAPDNIMVTEDGGVMLIDFGAARYSMGEKSRSLDVILKHGFAPKEQYARHSRQGAYTDVYAMAATFYYTITGKVPPDAIERTDIDELVPPTKLGVKMSRKAEAALMKALAVNFAQRWQSMREFSETLKKELPPDRAELERQKHQKLEVEKRRQAELEARRRAEEERRAAQRRAREEQRAETQRLKELKKTEKAEKASKTAESETPKKKKPTALIAVLAAIAIGAGAFFALGGEDKAESPAIVSEAPDIVSEAPDIVSEAPDVSEISSEIRWELSEDGTLTISGTGAMPDYMQTESLPWAEQHYQGKIKKLVIESGITHIGALTAGGCWTLEEVRIADTVTSIGGGAFISCENLRSVNIPQSVTKIEGQAFENCSQLSIEYDGSEEQWDKIDIVPYGNDNLDTGVVSFS